MYILIVTGLSGAGKTGALNVLEDMGFVCADNMPCQLIGEYLALCESSENTIDKVAIVIDSRESHFGYNPRKAFSELKHLPYKYEIMFLECEDAVLQRRYSETRRLHPMHDDVSIGISLERDMLMPLKENATYIIDTTNMRPQELSRAVEEKLSKDLNLSMRLIVSSFGFKRGIPGNADFVFDMRYTENPFYFPELRYKSGRDPEVRNYVFSDKEVVMQLDGIEEMIRMLIPKFIEQGKRRLMIAFGCTGGRHRSVAMAEALHDRLSRDYPVLVEHRDLVYEADDIKDRFDTDKKQ
ncbi:MAG: RNase adapter RapZ [Clostridia bacterium]|nr:RNase adapter RapZ [Clostridia bacterium]